MSRTTLLGRVVVITGASSGFGRGAALAFAEHGAKIVLAARRDDLLERLVRGCETHGGTARAVPTDVISERPSGAIAIPSSCVGPKVTCSGSPRGNGWRQM